MLFWNDIVRGLHAKLLLRLEGPEPKMKEVANCVKSRPKNILMHHAAKDHAYLYDLFVLYSLALCISKTMSSKQSIACFSFICFFASAISVCRCSIEPVS